MQPETLPEPIHIPRSNVANVFTYRFVAALQVALVAIALLVGYLSFQAIAHKDRQIELSERV